MPTILLVEDEDPLRELLQFALSENYDVVTSRDGQGAVSLLRSYPGSLDVLVADAGLPDFNGWELLTLSCQIRPAIKCVMMSGYPPLPNQSHLCRFLRKPFQLSELQHIVSEVLGPVRQP
jgi:DNA-binding NtrC family response regulator